MDASAVSVVIPAFNAAGILPAAIASAQGDPAPGEIIVVDDGSTDGTANAAAGYAGVRVVRQDNAGPAAARNRGLAEAAGDWVAFLDADDRWLPGKLAAQLAVLRAHPATVLVAGDWVRNGPGPVVPAGAPTSPISYRELLELNRFQTSTVLARRDVLRRLGGFDPGLDVAEDWDMWLRTAREGPVLKLDVPVVVYADTPGGVSKDLLRLYQRMLVMLERERDLAPLPPRQFDRVLAWHYERFATAFALAGDVATARRVLADLRARGLLAAAPGAAVRYLLPFLGGRVARRVRPRG